MALYFENNYPETVYIAILYYDPECGVSNQNFYKCGWFACNPNCSIVPAIPPLEGNLQDGNARAYFFAQQYSRSVGATWTGKGNAWTFVPNGAAFAQCFEDNNNTQQQVDFIDIEFDGYADVTVGLGPEAGIWLALAA